MFQEITYFITIFMQNERVLNNTRKSLNFDIFLYFEDISASRRVIISIETRLRCCDSLQKSYDSVIWHIGFEVFTWTYLNVYTYLCLLKYFKCNTGEHLSQH